MNQQQLEQQMKRSPTLSEDRALRHLFLAQNEELQDMKRAVLECGKLMDRMSEQLIALMNVNIEMKNRIDRQFRPEDDLNPATKAIGDDN